MSAKTIDLKEMSEFTPKERQAGYVYFCTEASQLQWEPGRFDETLQVRWDGKIYTLIMTREITRDGELVAVEYDSRGMGLIIVHVLND